MSLLRTENLTKSFGSLVVTKDVNLVVQAGERHVLIGRRHLPEALDRQPAADHRAGQPHRDAD